MKLLRNYSRKIPQSKSIVNSNRMQKSRLQNHSNTLDRKNIGLDPAIKWETIIWSVVSITRPGTMPLPMMTMKTQIHGSPISVVMGLQSATLLCQKTSQDNASRWYKMGIKEFSNSPSAHAGLVIVEIHETKTNSKEKFILTPQRMSSAFMSKGKSI